MAVIESIIPRQFIEKHLTLMVFCYILLGCVRAKVVGCETCWKKIRRRGTFKNFSIVLKERLNHWLHWQVKMLEILTVGSNRLPNEKFRQNFSHTLINRTRTIKPIKDQKFCRLYATRVLIWQFHQTPFPSRLRYTDCVR